MESRAMLVDMKQSHSVEMAEFASVRGISNEAAFAWWVSYTLRKRDIILSLVKPHIQKPTHKYGIEVLPSVAHARKLTEETTIL